MSQMESNRSLQPPVIRVAVVDDHPWVRMGLVAMLATEDDFMVCGEADDAPGAIELVAASKPDLVIIDISLKGDVDGIELTRQLKTTHPQLVVLTLSLHAESEYQDRALAAGASAYVNKSAVNDCLFDTIRRIMSGAASRAVPSNNPPFPRPQIRPPVFSTACTPKPIS